MIKKTKTTILTSKENHVWESMTEIIPSLEQLWKASENSNDHIVEIINVDDKKIADIFFKIIDVDNIVFTAFTTKISIIAKHIREKMNIDARYIFHLHGQATIACWPLFEWGIGNVLMQDDIFISTCTRDQESLNLTFENPTVKLIPFNLSAVNGINISDLNIPTNNNKEIPLIYIGRISEQKNLHKLLIALHILKINNPKINFKLDIYGKEDNLGSPNMELSFPNYLNYLIDLTATLSIKNNVEFKGFVKRDNLYKNIKNLKHIFISPSIHSDENFGMAAFRSLCMGNQAVLSDWGGHIDFNQYFPKQVNYTSVYNSKAGPHISSTELASKILNAIDNYQTDFTPNIPNYYQDNVISNQLLEIARENHARGPKIQDTPLAKEIHKTRNHFLKQNNGQGTKIFKSYGDSNATPFFRHYGMKNLKSKTSIPKLLTFAPWVSLEYGKIIINCPHRGIHEININRKEMNIPIQDIKGNIFYIDVNTNRQLYEYGYAY